MILEEIKQKHTRVEKSGYGYETFFVVENQSFRVCDETTLDRANWYADQLAKALERIIK